jgi:hypothetical protein
MLSLPVRLSAGADGGLHVAPHPDVDTLRAARIAARDTRVDLTGDERTGGLVDLEVTLPAGAHLRLDTDDAPVVLAAEETGLMLDSAGGRTVVPARGPRPELELRVVVDRGVVEAWTGDGRWAALRIPGLRVRTATVVGGGAVDAWELEPVQAPPAG